MGNDRNAHLVSGDSRHRKADPLQCYGAFLDDVTRQIHGNASHQPVVSTAAFRLKAHDRGNAIDMALNNVAAKAITGTGRQLKIHERSSFELRERSTANGLSRKVGAEAASLDFHRSEAHATHGDARALHQFSNQKARLYRETALTVAFIKSKHAPYFFDDSGK